MKFEPTPSPYLKCVPVSDDLKREQVKINCVKINKTVRKQAKVVQSKLP